MKLHHTLTFLYLSLIIAQAGDSTYTTSPVQLDSDEPIQLWTSKRPDGHAPIGVMADHGQRKGELMLSYRYMQMSMEQNFDGNSRVRDRDILSPTGENFRVTPQWMDMEMHMFGLMASPMDHLTLMLMLPYSHLEMGHLRRDGVEFTTEAEGWGDLKLTGIYELYHGERSALLLNLGLSAPTGSTSKEDVIPGLGKTRLPYPMQIGSGTWDLLPGLTYLSQSDDWSWGAQLSGVIRLGENDEGYSLGNVGQVTGWSAYRWSDMVSTSLRVTGKAWGDIDGRDRSLLVGPAVVPTADPGLRGGEQIDLSLGINLLVPSGALKGHRIAAEVGMPVYRSLDGPQLSADWFAQLGWQWSF